MQLYHSKTKLYLTTANNIMQTFFKTDFKNSCSLFLAMDAASINETVWFLYSSKKFSKMLFDDNL